MRCSLVPPQIINPGIDEGSVDPHALPGVPGLSLQLDVLAFLPALCFWSFSWLLSPSDCIFISVCLNHFLQFHELLYQSPSILTSVVFPALC